MAENEGSAGEEPDKINMKFVLVGDGAVGKTSLIHTFMNKGFPEGHEPTIVDQYYCEVPFSATEVVSLQVWDTAGQENLEELRLLSYSNADLFLICYSCVEKSSYTNIPFSWVKEIEEYETVNMLVGTKVDLLNDPSTDPKQVTTAAEGDKLRNQIRADASIQCSAKLNDRVQETFKRSIKLVYDKRNPGTGGCCLTL